MPVNLLFVEGNLDAEILTPILQGSPAAKIGGSKHSLRHRARMERESNRILAGYLRDRDFDFDPPDDVATPTVDGHIGGTPFGWRWCRHEIENYLIDPAIVAEAFAITQASFEEHLRRAAVEIRNYQAARWTVGVARRSLPPHYDLKTRPDGLGDIGIPADLDETAARKWAMEAVERHRAPIAAATDSSNVRASFDGFTARFQENFISQIVNILYWFSGKDLLAALARCFPSQPYGGGRFRGELRDWIRANTARAVELLPEWQGLVDVVRREG